MRILSFGWTADKLLAGKKTVTRRKWKKAWVKPGELVQAWDKGPHRGGRKLGLLRILSIRLIRYFPEETTEEECTKEGFDGDDGPELNAVLEEGGIERGDLIYRVEFEPVGELCRG